MLLFILMLVYISLWLPQTITINHLVLSRLFRLHNHKFQKDRYHKVDLHGVARGFARNFSGVMRVDF